LKPYELLIEQGIVEIEALCYIRGRSIPNRYFVLDEAQQLTPLEAKTVVTRMSKGSSSLWLGTRHRSTIRMSTAGLTVWPILGADLKGQAIAAHVCLTKGERSPLAEAGGDVDVAVGRRGPWLVFSVSKSG